jgi:histone-lysine N-methyltransferase SUV420H
MDSNESGSDSPKKSGLNLNERRTRRGVYAVTQKKEDSEESEDEADDVAPTAPKDVTGGGEIELLAEVDTASDLTSLPPSRAQSNSALQAVAGPSSLPTPESPGIASPAPSALTSLSPALTARSSSALTSLSSSADDLHSTPKSTHSPSFRSIIATRGQKAKASTPMTAALSKQLMTPPLSEDPDTPTKRLTRSASAVMLSSKRGAGNDKGKGKQKASNASTPVPTPLSGRTQKGKEKEAVDVKKEEAEPRILRTRPSLPAMTVEVNKEPPPKRETPKGPDGKPLPTCSTCSNVLPVISVDSQVVWGLEPATKGKKKKQDCPR